MVGNTTFAVRTVRTGAYEIKPCMKTDQKSKTSDLDASFFCEMIRDRNKETCFWCEDKWQKLSYLKAA